MFVEMDCYRRDVGEPNPSDIVEEDIDGTVTRGVFMLAPGEKCGYHHVEDYQDRGVLQKTTINDGQVEINDGDIQSQFARMQKGVADQETRFFFRHCIRHLVYWRVYLVSISWYVGRVLGITFSGFVLVVFHVSCVWFHIHVFIVGFVPFH